MRKRSEEPAASTGSAYIRHLLAIGEPPEARCHGWVAAMATLGADNVPKAELIRRYGDALRAECRASGFAPAYDIPIRKQSAEAQRAAATWARHLLDEHTY